jgi:exodeoxyribonuclease VII large subunit
MKIFEVSQVNRYIKELLSRDDILNSLWVKGEISNFKYHSSGHMYFTLKDSTSILKCVMFKTDCSNLKFLPADGMKVILAGYIGLFERDGQYQFYCSHMQPDGLGALYVAFEQLKAKLEKEGLFSMAHKKQLPAFPKTIGVVTSRTGAVIRDIIQVSLRRNPNVHISLFPVAVQGGNASGEIAHAIKVLNEKKLVDVIIIGRGGGSLEELWAFNEEAVARAIFDSHIPIVSAVGHETDYTIADLVADLRAPTPSAAAELVVPNVKEIIWKLQANKQRLALAARSVIAKSKVKVEHALDSPAFKQPFDKIYQSRMALDIHQKYLNKNALAIINRSKEKLSANVSILNSLSPFAVLARGYSIASDEKTGKIIKSVKQVVEGQKINVRVADGDISCRVM